MVKDAVQMRKLCSSLNDPVSYCHLLTEGMLTLLNHFRYYFLILMLPQVESERVAAEAAHKDEMEKQKTEEDDAASCENMYQVSVARVMSDSCKSL